MKTAIKVEHLSKAYQLGQFSTGTLSRDLERWWALVRGKEDPFLRIGEVNHPTSKNKSRVVWSLKDISFDIEQGDLVGIIGKNGAGKSTLLKILSKITSPTEGCAKINGRIASLLEIGTGFHPELTGRENVYLNGAILGMRKKEITRKFDEIVEFSGIENYIDTPVKRYSSGMYVRLAFAVAAHLESEILIIDEVLAVGDAEFQKRCLGKMNEVSRGDGRTVLFVSHNMSAISRLCSKGILLHDGRLAMNDNVQNVIEQYMQSNFDKTDHVWHDASMKDACTYIRPVKLFLSDDSGEIVRRPVSRTENIYLNIEFKLSRIERDLTVGYTLFDVEGNTIYRSLHTDMQQDANKKIGVGMNLIRSRLPLQLLNEGTYKIVFDASLYKKSWDYNPFSRRDVAISVTIEGGYDTSAYWMNRRAGIIAPQLMWDTTLL